MIHRDRGILQEGGLRIRVEPLQETVYRYRAINEWLEAILVDDMMYFATPSECNDPFDCRVDVSLSAPLLGVEVFLKEQQVIAQLEKRFPDIFHRTERSLLINEELAGMTDAQLRGYAEKVYADFDLGNPERHRLLKAEIESARNRIGVCCFAGRGDNLLMFAHYAAQHQGCCLEFQIRDANGQRGSIFEDPGLDFRDVVYTNDVPVVHLYEFGTAKSINVLTLTKHSRWAYEEEVRCIREKPGPFRYRREALTGVIFGYRASSVDVTKAMNWLGTRKDVKLSRAIPNQSGGLDVVPLEGRS